MFKTGFARYVVRRLPVGIAAAPFESAFFLTYLLVSAKYLLDIMLFGVARDAATLNALPLKGDSLNWWLASLFAGSLAVCVGLLFNGYRPILGFRLERAGLCSAGAMIVVYVLELYSFVGFSFNLGFITILLELGAVLYRIALVGRALDSLTEPKKGSDPQ